jgi:chromosome partitioning protein
MGRDGAERIGMTAPGDAVSRETSSDHSAPSDSADAADRLSVGGPQPDVSRETATDPALAAAEIPGVDDARSAAGSETVVPDDGDTPDTAATTAADVSRETEQDTPIAREAAQAVHVLNVRQEHWPRPPRTRVLTVANQKGGVGKTTSAVNIAAAMAMHGLRVLLIDLDPQGNASTALGVEHTVGTPSIYDVLLSGRPLAEVSRPTEFAPTLLCAPATLDLAGADIELTSQVAREYRLQRALESYLAQAEELDYVFIDCPPSLGLLTLNALVAGREVFIPIQCEYYALEGLAQLLNTVELVTSHLNPRLAVTTVLLTMYDSRTRLADQVAEEVRKHFGELVLEPVIPRNVRVSEAPGFGQTVMTYDAGSRGAIGYLQAARELAERGGAADSEGGAGE